MKQVWRVPGYNGIVQSDTKIKPNQSTLLTQITGFHLNRCANDNCSWISTTENE